MTSNIRLSEAETVPLNSITPHPENARRGDVDKIAESLAHHGQYKPIVVNNRDKTILAGNHTYKAAKRLKWKNIAVVWVDVDDTTAKRIILADNRTSDLGSYNEPALKALLEELDGDFAGTGFTADDVANLSDILEAPFAPSSGGRTPKDDEYQLVLGPIKATIDPDVYISWEEMILDSFENNKARAIKGIKEMLQIPLPPPPVMKDPSVLVSPPETVKSELVDIKILRPYPNNPREGDIGAIAQSLQELGQYRPIVARTDGTILAGNHTYQAAKALGWSEIAVNWIACTDEEAARIVLVDNRTADHATYDSTALKQLIGSLPDWNGTGYTPSDVAEILGGGSARPGPDTSGKTSCKIGNLTFRIEKALIWRWAAGLTMADVAERLQMPEQALTTN